MRPRHDHHSVHFPAPCCKTSRDLASFEAIEKDQPSAANAFRAGFEVSCFMIGLWRNRWPFQPIQPAPVTWMPVRSSCNRGS